MPEREDRIVHFDELNLLGKAVFLGGAAVRATSSLIDAAIDRAVDVVLESEKAFKQGLDPTIEDAKVLEEREERPPRHAPPGDRNTAEA